MESPTLKAENLKPIILKAGFPLALSLAGVIYAWIITKKSFSKSQTYTSQTKKFHRNHGISTIIEESLTDGGCQQRVVNGRSFPFVEPLEILFFHCRAVEKSVGIPHVCCCSVSGLRSNIEDLKNRELELNFKFERFCEMKEQESLLMEIKNMISLEIAHIEFLDREVQSLENFVVLYMRVVEKIEDLRSENRVMNRKFQKLVKRLKVKSRLIKRQNMKIKAGEEEILRNNDELKRRIFVIDKLEDELKELQGVFDQLLGEKNQLLMKLETAEKGYESKIKEEYVSKEDYKQILNELEQIKKEQTMNESLKHELNKQNQQKHDHQDKDHNIGVEFEEGNGGITLHYESDHEFHLHSSLNHHNVNCFGSPHSEQNGYSRRKRLLRRLKRLVEGSEKVRMKHNDEGENNQLGKLFGMHFVPHVVKESHVPPRKSCSSA